jgi:hypothetical protein
MRKITKLLGITIALEGAEDRLCLPMDATRVEVFKGATTETVKK